MGSLPKIREILLQACSDFLVFNTCILNSGLYIGVPTLAGVMLEMSECASPDWSVRSIRSTCLVGQWGTYVGAARLHNIGVI